MVFFVCEGCNETLKKNQVDKHANSCRRCNAVTCVDCQVSFYGDDYRAHIVCVSEAEKYEKSLYKGKKEKANPQDAWMELIAQCAAMKEGTPNVRRILDRIVDSANVPRNKKKFVNFIKNSMNIYADAPIEEVWDFLENVRNKAAAEAKAEPAPVTATEEAPTKQQKRKLDEVIEAGTDDTNAEAESKQERKKKKKKSAEKAEVGVEEDEAAAAAAKEDNEAKNATAAEKKKSKKEKKKSKKSDSRDGEVEADVNAEEEEQPQEKKKKKKKDKK